MLGGGAHDVMGEAGQDAPQADVEHDDQPPLLFNCFLQGAFEHVPG